MTGRIPASLSCISRAAERVELDGQQHTGFLVIISLTFMATTSRISKQDRFRLSGLQGFDVLVQVTDPQLYFGGVSLAHAPE